MYEYKEKYTLDFSKIEHWEEFHQIIKAELDFPNSYGGNWSAFWDCLTEILDVEEPLNIEILGAEILEQKFPGTLKKMIEILKRLKHWHSEKYYDFVKVEIVCGDARYEIQ